MSSASGTGNDAGNGCALLVVGVIALAILGFIIEHIEVFLTIGVLVAVLAGIGYAFKSHSKAVAEAPPEEKSAVQGRKEPREVRQARWTGKDDMRTAWMQFQLGTLPAQATHPGMEAFVNKMAAIPRTDWNLSQLRKHGLDLWPLREGARQIGRIEEVDARLDRVAAMISDLTADTFDTKQGQKSDKYLYSQDRQVREAYMDGGALGVEAIMDTVTAARIWAREEMSLKASAESAAEQRNAALKALRETHRPTESRDAQADWEAKAKDLGL